MLLLLLACATPEPTDTAPQTVPWSAGLPRLDAEVRGRRYVRGIAHLHSSWSHDACDGDPLPDGAVNEPCLADLRAALCTAGMDFAYLTDHPTHAADQPFEDLLLPRGDDIDVTDDGSVIAKWLACEDGTRTLWMPGIEDTLMPLGLERHAGDGDPRAVYTSRDPAAIAAEQEAGAVVVVNHPEGEARETLLALQEAGIRGLEAFNLHAMVDPSIRGEDLGLDPWQWASDIAPFTDPHALAEPDLLFLAFFQDQPPSLAHWDALSAVREGGPALGLAGTDAHQNVLPLELRDGERVDSYRRMIRWFSNWLAVEGDPAPATLDAALDAGRLFVVFEALGTPADLDVVLEADDGALYEPGQDAPAGTLRVSCPTLDPRSPRGTEAPELTTEILRDGEIVATGCGDHVVDVPGVYRVVHRLTPYHLRPFLGDDPEPWLHPYPWIYSNPIRVRGGD
ncbi:MAG: hypothetical protein H6739_38800 [Alphaproteobacteria bacterium]|nr:hypothetical protein [Alphaproteobacteria bacterium]